mgnify:CR=1 FL=1
MDSYQKKLQRVTSSLQRDRFSNSPQPNSNPFTDELTAQLKKFEKDFERSERYAKSIIELERRRYTLLDIMKDKEDRSLRQKMNYQKEIQKRLKEQAEIYEDRLKRAEEKQKEEFREMRMLAKKKTMRLLAVYINIFP